MLDTGAGDRFDTLTRQTWARFGGNPSSIAVTVQADRTLVIEDACTNPA